MHVVGTASAVERLTEGLRQLTRGILEVPDELVAGAFIVLAQAALDEDGVTGVGAGRRQQAGGIGTGVVERVRVDPDVVERDAGVAVQVLIGTAALPLDRVGKLLRRIDLLHRSRQRRGELEGWRVTYRQWEARDSHGEGVTIGYHRVDRVITLRDDRVLRTALSRHVEGELRVLIRAQRVRELHRRSADQVERQVRERTGDADITDAQRGDGGEEQSHLGVVVEIDQLELDRVRVRLVEVVEFTRVGCVHGYRRDGIRQRDVANAYRTCGYSEHRRIRAIVCNEVDGEQTVQSLRDRSPAEGGLQRHTRVIPTVGLHVG